MPASLASRRASGDEKTRPLAVGGRRSGWRWRGCGQARPSALRLSEPQLRRGLGCRLRRFGRLRRGRAARSGARRLCVLALARQHGDQLVHRHVGGAFRHHDLGERALVDRLDLHRGLVGLDLGDHVAGLHLLAFLLQPLGEIALLHRGRQRGHQDVDRHGVSSARWWCRDRSARPFRRRRSHGCARPSRSSRNLSRIDAPDMARDVGDQHAPGLRIVERAAQRDMQRTVHDHGAQHLDAALARAPRAEHAARRRPALRLSLTAFP